MRWAPLTVGLTLTLVIPMESVFSAEYLIGRGIADITGPPVGVQMLGFVRADQVSEGIHQRQFARAFAIASLDKSVRLVHITCDIAFPTHTLKLDVLDRVNKSLPGIYRHENVVLTGTHTHGAPGGYHHHLAKSPIDTSGFCQVYFEQLAEGIAESIILADADMEPGDIYLTQGQLDNTGVNRSAVAYQNNPPEERMKYEHDTDRTMTLLKFVDASGTIGVLNWFAVHPTSMTFFNKLVAGDNKGYASYEMEQSRGVRYGETKNPFVAAFSQTNCGDVTPNLNLNNTGPGKTDVESTAIIGHRHVVKAEELCKTEGMKLSGTIEMRHAFIDFSKLVVSDEFTGRGDQHTCPSAFGYSFAAGSTEDGGGHPLFREGMKQSNPLIDSIVRAAMPDFQPSDSFKECQKPKIILFAPGLSKPPMQEQVVPIGIVRLGPLVWVVGPAEYTTMTGRHFREAVGKELGVEPKHVVVVGYANDFAGYVTTWHEYMMQQYEGGHTLFGPWTESGYRQEFVKLARAMKANKPVESTGMPTDMRGSVPPTPIDGPDELPPEGAAFGDVVNQPKPEYKPGEIASATFWTGRPSNDFHRDERTMVVERKDAGTGKWIAHRADYDWDTTIRYRQSPPSEKSSESDKPKKVDAKASAYDFGGRRTKSIRPEPTQADLAWTIPATTPTGEYRFVLFGKHKKEGMVDRFRAESKPFQVSAP